MDRITRQQQSNGVSVAALLAQLEGVKRTGPGSWIANCPAHDDRSPSLSVRALDDGRTLIYCFAQCFADDVVSAVGMTLADLMPSRAIGHHVPRERRPFNAQDVLACLDTELTIATLATLDISKGKLPTEVERERLLLASRRIHAAIELTQDNAN